MDLLFVAMLTTLWGWTQSWPYLAADPYREILSNPNYRPKPEVIPNKTIDQLITEAYGGLPMYMSENFLDLGGGITAELDMILTPEQYNSFYGMESESGARHKRKATRPEVLRWTNKVIPYEFVTSHFSSDEVYYIKAAMDRWANATCLTFRPFQPQDKNRIRFQNGNGCNSLLGMSRGVQPINLQAPGCRYSGLYLHEIGHAIGLVHEHQLPDRDQYIYVIYDNVAPSMRIWFNKYPTSEVNQFGVPYEYSSVMHYGVTAFSKDGAAQTIQAKDASREKEIGRVYLKGLSFSDIKVVNLMYECNKHCPANSACVEPSYLDKNCACVTSQAGSGTDDNKPTGDCVNNWDNDQCNGWASDGECDANPIWMRENCKSSCKACSGTATDKPETGCQNIWGDAKCEGWASSGECDANPIWMRENCKRACQACSTGTGGGTTSVPCNDDNQYCQAWASSNYCQTNWYTQQHCRKSCNTCDVTPRPNQDSHIQNKPASQGSTAIVSLISTLYGLLIAHLAH